MYSQCQLIPNGTFIVDPEKASSPDGVSLRVPNSANDDPYWMRHMVGSCNGILFIRYNGVENKKRSNLNTFYLLHSKTLRMLETLTGVTDIVFMDLGLVPSPTSISS
ncbi:hypothetical protein ACLB2K_070804 [Fragaria x ananassa]